jgi:hypothetical protein
MNDITLDEAPDLGDAGYSCTFTKHGVCVVWPARHANGDRVEVHIPVRELSDASAVAGGETFGANSAKINRALREFKSRIQDRVSKSKPVDGRIVLGPGSL